MRLIGGVDTGATTSLLRESTARRLGLRIGPPRVRLFDVEGRPLSVKGEALVKVRLASPGSNSRSVVIPVAVVERMDLDVDVLLGATAHKKLGSKLIWNTKQGDVSYIAAVNDRVKTEDGSPATGEDDDDATRYFRSEDEFMSEREDSSTSRSTRSVRWATPLVVDELDAKVKDEDDGSQKISVPPVLTASADVVIEDPDFVLRRVDCQDSEGQRYKWIVKWRWRTGVDPERIPSSEIEKYKKKWWKDSHTKQYDLETSEWIKSGFLIKAINSADCKFIPWSCSATPQKSTPLRLALDFTSTNEFVRNRAEWSQREVCSDELLRWRTSEEGGELIDVRKAYMRIHVDESLWRFQAVRVKGEPYLLTRLAFGLSSAPRVLKKVLDHVLRGLPIATFRDDVFIPRDVLTDELRDEVRRRLIENGFPTKEPENIGGEEACKVLGLSVSRRDGEIYWNRKQPLTAEKLDGFMSQTRLNEIASAVGHLCPTSHPILGWSRPLANAIRSLVGKEAALQGWSAEGSDELVELYHLLLQRLKDGPDPSEGIWKIKRGETWKVYSDASKAAIGYIIKIENNTIEDGSQISSTRQSRLHINVRELDAMVLVLNRLYQIISQIRKMKEIPNNRIELFCDNKSVVSWLNSLINDEPIKLQTMSYALVESRLELIREIIKELRAKLMVTWIPTHENPADELTRIQELENNQIAAVRSSNVLREEVTRLHRELLHKGAEILVAELVKRGVPWSQTEISRAGKARRTVVADRDQKGSPESVRRVPSEGTMPL